MGWHWQWSGQWSELVLVLVAEDRAGTDGSGQRESIAALAGTARGSTVGGCRPAPPYHRSCRSFTSPDEEDEAVCAALRTRRRRRGMARLPWKEKASGNEGIVKPKEVVTRAISSDREIIKPGQETGKGRNGGEPNGRRQAVVIGRTAHASTSSSTILHDCMPGWFGARALPQTASALVPAIGEWKSQSATLAGRRRVRPDRARIFTLH